MVAAASAESENRSSESGDASGPSAEVLSTQDRARLSLVALRDVAIAAALLSIFAAAEVWSTTSGLAIAGLLALIDGFLVGIALGALAHEWGHFIGARQAGAIAPLRPISGILPLYDYDYVRNSTRAFDWMSVGGNLAHAAVVIVLFLALPLDTVGTAALLSGAFGFAVFSSTIEIPVIQRSRAGQSPLEALAGIPKNFVRRYLPWSIGAGLLLFVIL